MRNEVGERWLWAFVEEEPWSTMAAWDVPAAEEREVFGSMSARISARGASARRERGRGFPTAGCCERRSAGWAV